MLPAGCDGMYHSRLATGCVDQGNTTPKNQMVPKIGCDMGFLTGCDENCVVVTCAAARFWYTDLVRSVYPATCCLNYMAMMKLRLFH